MDNNQNKSAPPAMCACGCGQPVKWQVAQKRWGTFLRGHCHVGRPNPRKGVPLSDEHRAAIAAGRLRAHPPMEAEPDDMEPRTCLCGCGQPVNFAKGIGWRRFVKGHGAAKVGPVTEKLGAPPLCACGCNNPVRWKPGVGWARYIVGHVNKGRTFTAEHKRRQSEAATARQMLIRMAKGTVGVAVQSIYGTRDYKDRRKELVEGKPCMKCGAVENIHAHHQIAGDNTSLVPLCDTCHAKEHHGVAVVGTHPPEGAVVPACACGCGKPVRWRAYVGWRETAGAGHLAGAKVPTGTRLQEAPLCGCGCGEAVKFTFGKGWNKYKRGHGQRVLGTSYRVAAQRLSPPRPVITRPTVDHGPAPECACGCKAPVTRSKRGNRWNEFVRGHAAKGKAFSPEHRAALVDGHARSWAKEQAWRDLQERGAAAAIQVVALAVAA